MDYKTADELANKYKYSKLEKCLYGVLGVMALALWAVALNGLAWGFFGGR